MHCGQQASINICSYRWGFQPLDDAIKSIDPILFHLLVGHGAKLSDGFQRRAILDASREGSIQLINLLGESGADLNSCNYDKVSNNDCDCNEHFCAISHRIRDMISLTA